MEEEENIQESSCFEKAYLSAFEKIFAFLSILINEIVLVCLKQAFNLFN